MEKQGSTLFELSIEDISAVSGGESSQLTTTQEPAQTMSLSATAPLVPTPGPFPTN